MARRFGSIKLRIIAIVVLFSIASTLAMVSLALYQFRQSARQNLLQSTEFNLNLVTGLISQDLEALRSLRSWCGNDDSIARYMADAQASSVDASYAYERLAAQAQAIQSYRHLLRAIVVSEDHQRILQTGTGTSAGVPVQKSSIQLLENLDLNGAANQWDGIASDPFSHVDPAAVLVTSTAVHQVKNLTRSVVGTSYLMVSINIITEPIRNYTLPADCRLYLTIGEQSFSLDGKPALVAPATSSIPTRDSVLNSRTKISQCTNDQGSSFLAVTCPVGNTNLYLTQTISDKALASQQGLMDFQVAIFCFSVVLMGLIMLLLLNRMISKPIVSLKKRMNAISQGDFTPDDSIEWNNELGEIGRGINDLARNVQTLMERRVSDEKARQELEYEVLLNQVNPHFLYNSLNSIKWMATIQQVPGIAEMTASLARLLKTVSKGKHTLIPLSDEIALLEDYYVIQKYRYGGDIVLEKEISPETEPALLPRFTLQPLLENAIFHGIEPKGGVGTIVLTAGRIDDDLMVTLSDDGVGIPEDQIAALLSDSTGRPSGLFRGIGISNVHSRIQREFGPRYGLTIESKPGAYTRIHVRLPFTTERNLEEAQ